MDLSTFQVFLLQFFLITSLFVALYFPGVKKCLGKKSCFTLFLIAIASIQLGTSALLRYEVGDVMLFSGAGHYYRQHIDFYFIDQFHTQYPFFPFLIFLHAGLNWLQELLPIFTFSFYLKIVLLAALLGISRAIHHERKNSQVEQLRFLTHPITTLVVFFHGQIDVILLSFFVWSLIYLFQKKETAKNWLIGTVLYAFSIAAKTWSVIFLPYMLYKEKSWIKRILLPIGVIIILMLDIFIYTRTVDGSSFRTVLPAVAKPGGPVGIWGISLFFSPYSGWLQKYNLHFFAVSFGLLSAYVIWMRHSLWKSIFLLVLGVYLVLPNWGIQYLFWCLPFVYLAELDSRKIFILFTITASFYAFTTYALLSQGIVLPTLMSPSLGVIVWAVVAFWWGKELKNVL